MDRIPLKRFIYEYKILGSTFYAILDPVENEETMKTILLKLQEDYPKATHYCYAARITPYEAASDDGEPSHSAGLPILTLLRQFNVSYGLLTVIRYFGGTKLGLPRLTRTYRETAQAVLEMAKFGYIAEGEEASISLTYSDYEKAKKTLSRTSIEISDTTFEERVTITIKGDRDEVSSFLEGLGLDSLIVSRNKVNIYKEEQQ